MYLSVGDPVTKTMSHTVDQASVRVDRTRMVLSFAEFETLILYTKYCTQKGSYFSVFRFSRLQSHISLGHGQKCLESNLKRMLFGALFVKKKKKKRLASAIQNERLFNQLLAKLKINLSENKASKLK